MDILFVAGGNSKDFEIPPFITEQGEALKKQNINVSYFPIVGKGIKGYILNSLKIRKYLKSHKVDIIHAHYTLSGWATVLALPKQKIVLSLMGTDAYGEYIAHNKIKIVSRYLTFLTYLIQPFVAAIISKSKNIENYVLFKSKSSIIPNGIDIERFKPNNNNRIKYKGDGSKKRILFLGSKKNPRKNFKLVEEALRFLKSYDLDIVTPYPIKHEEVIKYLNNVDLLVFPSFMEGSPNLVKEAMACNCPVVATNVGDIKWLFNDTPGYFIADFNAEDFSNKIEEAIIFSDNYNRSNGRQRLIELELDSDNVAKKIKRLYEKILYSN